ncbi:MAG TPA: VRR-NUC domain-containing protein [Jiangellaceae bacterium]|nr:VRR-NUC domain-containing protein [Jiangellaceae bacterium]
MSKFASEAALQRAVVKILESLGIWVIRTGVSVKRGKRGTQSGEPGMPDLWTPLGWIEVKLPGEKLSPDQEAWHNKARKHGHSVRVAVVRSVSVTLKVIESWKRCELGVWR